VAGATTAAEAIAVVKNARRSSPNVVLSAIVISVSRDERAVLVGGAEIDIDVADAVTVEREELGVAEFLRAREPEVVGQQLFDDLSILRSITKVA
jgi:hypothetical protein